MNGVDKISLFALCAAFLGGAVMAYRGMNGTSDSLVFGGWLITLIAVGILGYYRPKSFCDVLIE